jgi:CheY-like chemotaxis protein
VLKLLVIEDDESDYHFIEMALKETRFPTRVRWVDDGEQAIEYLRGAGRYSDRGEFPAPDLITLDLKMPRLDGFELLEWIRAHAEYRHIPVLVMSSSGLQQDIERAYHLGANAYFVKPGRFEEFIDLFQHIAGYWSYARTISHAPAHR